MFLLQISGLCSAVLGSSAPSTVLLRHALLRDADRRYAIQSKVLLFAPSRVLVLLRQALSGSARLRQAAPGFAVLGAPLQSNGSSNQVLGGALLHLSQRGAALSGHARHREAAHSFAGLREASLRHPIQGLYLPGTE